MATKSKILKPGDLIEIQRGTIPRLGIVIFAVPVGETGDSKEPFWSKSTVYFWLPLKGSPNPNLGFVEEYNGIKLEMFSSLSLTADQTKVLARIKPEND